VSAKTFETQNVDLASFLLLEDVKFLGCSRSAANPNVVVLQFSDDKQNCLDLERVFLNSEFKKYRDINKWLLGKIHAALRDLPFKNS
jgi:hypothetical protein